MNRHSRLAGNDPAHAARQRTRGQRVFCSPRGRRGGCGRTFAIFLAEVLPRHSVPAGALTGVLLRWLGGSALKSAVDAQRTPFALETFYRLVRRLRRRLEAVRVRLCQVQPPPVTAHRDPLRQTLEHLKLICGDAAAMLRGYQLRFQQPLLG